MLRSTQTNELGYLVLKPEQINLFFKLMDERYTAHKPTLSTTNLEFEHWGHFLGNRPLTDAVLSRLRHRCVALRIEGTNLRAPKTNGPPPAHIPLSGTGNFLMHIPGHIQVRVEGYTAGRWSVADDTTRDMPQRIATSIYVVRGQRVMLDEDLAAGYSVTTKRLNEQLRRNAGRFPGDFIFELTSEEVANLRSQFATSRLWGGRRYLPHAFTEHGAIMMATVLNTPADGGAGGGGARAAERGFCRVERRMGCSPNPKSTNPSLFFSLFGASADTGLGGGKWRTKWKGIWRSE